MTIQCKVCNFSFDSLALEKHIINAGHCQDTTPQRRKYDRCTQTFSTERDYNRHRELYLKHYFDGKELDRDYTARTLKYIHFLWGRPVHLETIVDEMERIRIDIYLRDNIP